MMYCIYVCICIYLCFYLCTYVCICIYVITYLCIYCSHTPQKLTNDWAYGSKCHVLRWYHRQMSHPPAKVKGKTYLSLNQCCINCQPDLWKLGKLMQIWWKYRLKHDMTTLTHQRPWQPTHLSVTTNKSLFFLLIYIPTTSQLRHPNNWVQGTPGVEGRRGNASRPKGIP